MFSRKTKLLWAITILFALILAGCSVPKAKAGKDAVFAIDDYEGDLAVYFFHLENENEEKTGESILVKTPEGKTILIDAGMPESGQDVVDYLDELAIDKIDYVMLSHPHIDHIGGLPTIFEEKEIGRVIEINVPHDTQTYQAYHNVLDVEGIEIDTADAGDQFDLEDDLTIDILNPPEGTNEDVVHENISHLSAGPLNNLSMVMKLTYKSNSFLFTGDIYKSRELELLDEYGEYLQSDVLVASHHGGDTSSPLIFIEEVNPDFVMIPSNVITNLHIYDRFKDYGSETYHAAVDGNVVLNSDGTNIEAIPENDPVEKEEE